ncbi:MAG: glutamate--tRNA ligase [Acidobacteriota bacterium]
MYNWLFARREGGTFILRIEDTDEERSRPELVEGILEGLRWLGLQWDEGPYFQSERRELYRRTAMRLLELGHAYRDFGSPDDKAADPRRFRELPATESSARAAAGEPFAVRFRTPLDGVVRFEDVVFGEISIAAEQIEDFVLLRSDGTPTYHLSVVCDDVDMRITHVIRGADHLANTPKHVLLFRALGAPEPVWAHLPLILGPDRKRLSKRHGAASVTELADAGYLPQAVRNYLALLGWSPGDDSEFLPDTELIRRFELSRINKANAVFDAEKLAWLNKRHISETPAEDLVPWIRPHLEEAGLWRPEWENERRGELLQLVDLIKSRVADLRDFAVYGRPFFGDEFSYEAEAVDRYLAPGDPAQRRLLRTAVCRLLELYRPLEPFDLETTEATLRKVADEFGLKAGALIGAVRVALTGRGRAPGLFEMMVAFGKARTLDRLERLRERLAVAADGHTGSDG